MARGEIYHKVVVVVDTSLTRDELLLLTEDVVEEIQSHLVLKFRGDLDGRGAPKTRAVSWHSHKVGRSIDETEAERATRMGRP